MANGKCLRIGELVTIVIPKETRECGHNPFPDGTEAQVIGFGETAYSRLQSFGKEPGIYANPSCVHLRLNDGKEIVENDQRLTSVDATKYQARFDAMRDADTLFGGKGERLRDLPETYFWEGDRVHVANLRRNFGDAENTAPFTIVGIGYHDLDRKRDDGSPYPAYTVSDAIGVGWSTGVCESEMILVERGLVWKFYHNEPMTFANLQEEATFFKHLGHTEEVRNPVSGDYCWTKDQALAAIKDGICDAMSMGSFFGLRPSIRVERFRNRDLGLRVAQETLQGFA